MELIITIITLLIIIHCYRSFKLRFDYKEEKRRIILQKVIFISSIIASIVGAISGNWWGFLIVFILCIILVVLPRKD